VECRVTPHQQQIHYQWTCPHPPCDGKYRKVYNNLILIVAETSALNGKYLCIHTINNKRSEHTFNLRIQSGTVGSDTLVIRQNSKRLLRNTLITDPQQIKQGLGCTTSRSGGKARFRLEDNATEVHLNYTKWTEFAVRITHEELVKRNGQYQCIDNRQVVPFNIYLGNGKPYTNYNMTVKLTILHS
jgi:hypothetical protein